MLKVDNIIPLWKFVILMYAKCGELNTAKQGFDRLSERDVYACRLLFLVMSRTIQS